MISSFQTRKRPKRLTRLQAAMCANTRFDGSDHISFPRLRDGKIVFHEGDAPVESTGVQAPFSPPVTGARYILATHEPDFQSLYGFASDRPVSVARFEMLSLVVRNRLVRRLRRRNGAVECASNCEAQSTSDGDRSVEGAMMAEVPVSELNDLIAWASACISDPKNSGLSSAQIDGLKSGIQLYGCSIVPGNSEGRRDAQLALSNIKLPFSIRLICCEVACHIQANNLELSTLDLSGSALAGLDATNLICAGSLRLRRTAIFSPARLSGSRIGGVLDASDSVVMPIAPSSSTQALEADRGVLDLAEARVDNEIWLERARIWGGLNLRGMKAGRSLRLDDAVIVSPVGVLEKAAWKDPCYAVPGNETPGRQEEVRKRVLDGDFQIASEKLHNQNRPPGGAPLTEAGEIDPAFTDWLSEAAQLEIIPGACLHPATLRQLLSQNMRVRTSAIRADSVSVEGSIFARGAALSGRFRMRYAKIGGGVHLEGSTLRSSAPIGAWLDKLEPLEAASAKHLHLVREKTRAAAAQTEVPDDDDHAIDLQSINIGGDLSFGSISVQTFNDDLSREKSRLRAESMPAEFADEFEKIYRRDRQRCLLEGRIHLVRSQIRGSVKARRIIGCAIKVPIFPGNNPEEKKYNFVSGSHDAIERPGLFVYPGESVSIDRFSKDNAYENTLIEYLQTRLIRHRRTIEDVAQIDASGSVIGGDIDLRDSVNLMGLRVDGCRIGASVRLANNYGGNGISLDSEKNLESTSSITVKQRAIGFRGCISANHAEIHQDVLLVFDRRQGPTIKMEKCKIGGSLDIYPQYGSSDIPERPQKDDSQIFLGFDSYEEQHKQIKRNEKKMRMASRRLSPNAWAKYTQNWYIDLRESSSTSLCHPPEAWPSFGALSLSGYKYTRAAQMGPLGPHPFGAVSNGKFSFPPVIRLTSHVVVGTTLLGLTLPTLAQYAGMWTALGTFLFAYGIFGTLVETRFEPTLRSAKPMAIRYLSLQRPRRNRFRTSRDPYAPLDPYVMASKALREDGRNISADMVEAERLRLRAKIFSNRHHLLPKLGYAFLQITSGSGFNTKRAVFLLMGVVLSTAWTLHVVAPAPSRQIGEQPLFQAANMLPPLTDLNNYVGRNIENLKQASYRSIGEEPLFQAADMLLPFVDLDTDVAGKITKLKEASDDRSKFLEVVLMGLRIAAIALSVVLATALSLRARSAFERSRE
jgi:hypothetical protein